MKRRTFICLLLIVAIIGFTGVAFAYSNAVPSKIKTTGNVNLRAGPGTSYNVLFTIPAGTILEYAGETSGQWYCVDSGLCYGWIHSKYAEVIELKTVSTAVPESKAEPRPQKKEVLKNDGIMDRFLDWLFDLGILQALVYAALVICLLFWGGIVVIKYGYAFLAVLLFLPSLLKQLLVSVVWAISKNKWKERTKEQEEERRKNLKAWELLLYMSLCPLGGFIIPLYIPESIWSIWDEPYGIFFIGSAALVFAVLYFLFHFVCPKLAEWAKNEHEKPY